MVVGFGVGGLTVPFDILAEVLPTKHRGKNLLYIEYFWYCWHTYGTPICLRDHWEWEHRQSRFVALLRCSALLSPAL
jgi:hypothetical protein